MPDIAPEAVADTPPTDKKKARAERVNASQKSVRDGVIALYGGVGMLTTLVNQYDGMVILLKAEAMADSLIAACAPYPEAMKVLKLIARGNVWTTLVMAHLPVAMAIAANHGVIASGIVSKLGLPEPPERTRAEKEAEASLEAWRNGDLEGGDAHMRESFRAQVQQQYQQAEAQQMQNGAHLQAGGVGGPLGDAGEVAARRAFTEEQIARIRAEAIANALQQQNGAGQ